MPSSILETKQIWVNCAWLYQLVASQGTAEMNTPHLKARLGMLEGQFH